MKIVHVCLCGAMTDGFNYQENVITKYHKKMGHDVTIIASQYMWDTKGNIIISEKKNYINDDGVKMIRLPIFIGNINSRLKIYCGLYKTVEEEAPDILFIHDCQFLDILKLAKYAKKHLSTRIYVDNHVDYSNGAHGWISKNILHRGVWRYCVNRIEPYVRKFYGVLPARVDFLKELYNLPAEKCELLVMGADDELVISAAKPEVRLKVRAKYGISDQDFLVMTGGKIDAFKTQTLLLMEAVKNIPNKNVKLIVFGSVTDELIQKVNSLVDGERVQYVGWIKANNSYEYFAAADLVVFPGRHSVFWEQVVAQGIPMLCKDWKGTHHIDLNGNVEFLTKDTAEEIQKKIETLVCSREEYNKMKYVAVQRGMKKFAYSNIAKQSIEQ